MHRRTDRRLSPAGWLLVLTGASLAAAQAHAEPQRLDRRTESRMERFERGLFNRRVERDLRSVGNDLHTSLMLSMEAHKVAQTAQNLAREATHWSIGRPMIALFKNEGGKEIDYYSGDQHIGTVRRLVRTESKAWSPEVIEIQVERYRDGALAERHTVTRNTGRSLLSRASFLLGALVEGEPWTQIRQSMRLDRTDDREVSVKYESAFDDRREARSMRLRREIWRAEGTGLPDDIAREAARSERLADALEGHEPRREGKIAVGAEISIVPDSDRIERRRYTVKPDGGEHELELDR